MDDASFVMQSVRTADPDRYLSVLYAPEAVRPALSALYAFNAEIAGLRDRVREALPGEVRLQWWRDVIASADPAAGAGHPVASALCKVIIDHGLPRAAFDNYLEARIFDLYDAPMPSRTDLEGYCGETAGAMIQLASMVLDAKEAPRHAELAGHAACAQAITGLLMLLPRHRARGQCYVPRDVLAAAGTTPEAFLTGDGGAAAPVAVQAMTALAREHLSAFEKGAGMLPASLRPAYLPLALVRARLDRIAAARERALREVRDLALWRKQWLMFRRAAKGWRGDTAKS